MTDPNHLWKFKDPPEDLANFLGGTVMNVGVNAYREAGLVIMQMMGIRWDCPYCGQTDLPAAYPECPTCVAALNLRSSLVAFLVHFEQHPPTHMGTPRRYEPRYLDAPNPAYWLGSPAEALRVSFYNLARWAMPGDDHHHGDLMKTAAKFRQEGIDLGLTDLTQRKTILHGATYYTLTVEASSAIRAEASAQVTETPEQYEHRKARYLATLTENHGLDDADIDAQLSVMDWRAARPVTR